MKSVSIVALSAALVFGGASAASAADMYSGSLKDDPIVYTPPITWAGFYVGGHIGAGFGDGDGKCEYEDTIVSIADINGDDNGSHNEPCYKDYDDDDKFFLGGIHAGYNWEIGGGVSGSMKDGTYAETSPYLFGIEADVSFGDDIDYLASIRARLGLISGNALFYATAGVAFIGFEDGWGKDHDETGFVIGAGVEKKLSQDWSIGLEGLYYAFDDVKYDDGIFTYEEDADFWVVRARLSYHLTEDRYSQPLK